MKNLNKFKFLLVALLSMASLNIVNAQCTSSFTYLDNGAGDISFTNTSSTTSSVNYSWDFGDGNTSQSLSPNHTYSTNGHYMACLTIADSLGCSDVFCDTISVSGAAPCNLVANFTSVDNGNGNYSFTSASPSSLTHHWNFGDGITSSSYNPNHTYLANGTFVASLFITDSSNSTCYDYGSAIISVSGVSNPVPCNAAFVVNPDSSGNVIVYNTSTGTNITYFWDFGDGNTSTLAHPNYTYSTAGPFGLCLTIDDGNGCSDTYCDTIDSGGIVLKGGFTINVVDPTGVATGIENQIEMISELNTYPNPVRNILSIELNLVEQTQVEIFATDLLGNMVSIITNKNMNSGMNKLQWNTNEVPNGLYLLNIKSNNSVKVKKIVISK